MLPADEILGPALRYGLFTLLGIVAPGIAIPRLFRVRADAALVLPLGLAYCAAAYWLALVAGAAWLFPLLVLVVDATLLRTRLAWAKGPSARGALPALLAVALCFSVSVWRQDRLDETGAFQAGGPEADDAAFHVGLAYELTLGYPPEVPGLSGFPLGYHLGASLVRAAALRFAGVHPYNALSRFENTLYALALILALRAAVHGLGGSRLAVSLAGFSVLAADLSFLVAPGRGIEWWVGVFEGGTALQSLFHANSLVPALAMTLASLVALRRHLAGEGRQWLLLAALLSLACPFFKVFLAAQYLGALAVTLVLTRERPAVTALGLATGVGLLPLVLGSAGETMQVALEPLRVLNDARADLGFAAAGAAGLLLWLLPWLLISLGLRVVGLPRAVRAFASREPVAVAVAAFALSGWPLGLLFRISPLEAGLRERPFNEALYFFESSGILLWVFGALAIGDLSLVGARRALVLAGCAVMTLPSMLQFVWQERHAEPRRLSPVIVHALQALQDATRPGDVVLVRPERQRYPPPPLIVGRRVPFTRFIPFFAQLAPREVLRQRYERTSAFFTTEDPAEARAIARELQATAVCLFGADNLRFPKDSLLTVLFDEPGARIYLIR